MICLSERDPIRSWSDDGVAVNTVERAVITVWIVSEFTMCFTDVYMQGRIGILGNYQMRKQLLQPLDHNVQSKPLDHSFQI